MHSNMTKDVLLPNQLVRFKTFDRFASYFGTEPRRLNDSRLIHLIIYIKQGNGHCYMDNVYVPLKAGTLLLVEPYAYLHLENTRYVLGSVITFTESFFSKNYLEENLLYKVAYDIQSPSIIQLENNTEGISYINSNISMFGWEYRLRKDLASQNDFLHTLLYSTILYLHKSQLVNNNSRYDIEESLAKNRVIEFVQLLNIHFKEEDSLEFYAAKMNITTGSLNQICKRACGWTPKAIMQSKVLIEARRSLVFDSRTIQDIGFDLGFNEHASFIHFFRQHTGSTPKEFRMENGIKGRMDADEVA
jgi:AraC family transcriptional activator of pobA